MNFTENDLAKMLTNPFYCLSTIDDIFIHEHEPMVTEEQWVQSNVKLIKEIGEEKWLRILLENLKGNYLTDVTPEEN